jgi:hypothetical protein
VDAFLLKLVVRLLHTFAAAFVVGGGVFLWAQLAAGARLAAAGDVPANRATGLPTEEQRVLTPAGEPAASHLGAAIMVYEWGFWGAVGLLAVTGIGVAFLVVFSAWRTLVVARNAGRTGNTPDLLRTGSTLYGATAALTLGVMALAVRLAHP